MMKNDAIRRAFQLLKEQFGVEESELEFKLRERGRGKLYAFKECPQLGDAGAEKHAGIYFGKLEKDGLRLSIEGSFLVGAKARRGVLNLSDEEARKWLRGEDLESKVKGYVILKWRSYFLGCGKGNGKFIKNFVPKERRLSRDGTESVSAPHG